MKQINQAISTLPADGRVVVDISGEQASVPASVFLNTTSGDARYLRLIGGTLTGNLGVQGTVNASGLFIATGGGMQFPATQVPSAGANVLDDYEEGTWTPSVAFGGASVGVTYASRSGTYTKIGRLVVATFDFTLSAKGSSTGNASVTGLPFTGVGNAAGVSSTYSGMASLTSEPLFVSSGTTLPVRQFGATGHANVTDANFTNSSRILATISYEA